MAGNVIPIVQEECPDQAAGSQRCDYTPLRIFQLFVNVEGLEVRVRQPLLGLIPLGRRKRFGFYAVLTLAAPAASKPPMLLSLAHAALAAEFAPLSATPPEQWAIRQEQWRDVSAAPPLFSQPGCVDQEWGAAWYEQEDEASKLHRYRLARARLWKGRRARVNSAVVQPRTTTE